ncbi:MAG: hypothetical protein U0519_01580 [Candidatus Gracilibacteria bacterium]
MTKEDFKKLAESTYSFTQMDPETQAKVLASEGAEMESYIQMFTEENAGMAEAVKEFDEDSQNTVTQFKTVVKADKKDKLQKAEEESKKQEDQLINNLLNNV